MKAILVSDVHVKARLWTNFPGIQGDCYEALKEISKEIDSETVIISCGDLFDSNRPSSVDIEAVSKFIQKSKCMYYVTGNHDDCNPPFTDSIEGTTYHLSPTPVFLSEKTVICGIDFQNTHDKILQKLKEVAENLVAIQGKYTKAFLIMHQSLQEFFRIGTLTSSEVFSILGGNISVFIGDIHSYGFVKGPGEDQFILSPGPIVPQDISQAERPQYYYRLHLDPFTLASVSLKVRDYFKLDATVKDFNLYEAMKDVTSECVLPKAVVIKAYPGFKVPKDLFSDDTVFVVDTVRPPEEYRKETVELTIQEAIDAEIDNTEKDTADLMKALSAKLLVSDTPDEILENCLKKWKVIQSGN